MLQNVRVTAFTISELLRENQQGGGKIPPPSTPYLIRANQESSVEITPKERLFHLSKWLKLPYSVYNSQRLQRD